MNMPKWIH